MKNIILLLLVSLFLTACASFNETYRPLYQVKPEIESSQRD